MKHLNGLDSLRAFAAFFVIIAHFGVWFDDTSPSGRFIKSVMIPTGKFGVDLFFVLSSFLITSLLLNARRENASGHGIIIRNFFARRALRIFPIYFLLLFFLYAINYPDIRRNFLYFATYTANLLPYQTNTWNSYCHTWSLAVEEQFYLLWPWLIIYINERYLKRLFIMAMVIGVASTFIGMSLQGHMEPFLVFDYFDAFGLGGLYAYLRQHNGNLKTFERSVAVMAIISLGLCFYWKTVLLNNEAIHARFVIKTCNCVIALWLITLVVNNKSRLVERSILNNKPLNYLGKISYGIYLYHLPYLGYFFAKVNGFLYNATLPYSKLNSIIHDHHVDYWLELAIITAIAAASYRFIEKPILNLKRRFSYYGKEQAQQPVT